MVESRVGTVFDRHTCRKSKSKRSNSRGLEKGESQFGSDCLESVMLILLAPAKAGDSGVSTELQLTGPFQGQGLVDVGP